MARAPSARSMRTVPSVRSAWHEAHLAELELDSQIHEKGTRAAPLTEQQQASNRKKSKVRARVEHAFGAQAAMGGQRRTCKSICRPQIEPWEQSTKAFKPAHAARLLAFLFP